MIKNLTYEEIQAVKLHTALQLKGLMEGGYDIQYDQAFVHAYNLYSRVARTNTYYRELLLREYRDHQKSQNQSEWVAKKIKTLNIPKFHEKDNSR